MVLKHFAFHLQRASVQKLISVSSAAVFEPLQNCSYPLEDGKINIQWQLCCSEIIFDTSKKFFAGLGLEILTRTNKLRRRQSSEIPVSKSFLNVLTAYYSSNLVCFSGHENVFLFMNTYN